MLTAPLCFCVAAGRLMVPNNAAVGERSLMGLGSSGMAVGLYSSRASHDMSSPSSSARPTGEQAPAAADVAAAAVLTEGDLAKEKEVLLQETETVFLWEVPGGLAALLGRFPVKQVTESVQAVSSLCHGPSYSKGRAKHHQLAAAHLASRATLCLSLPQVLWSQLTAVKVPK